MSRTAIFNAHLVDPSTNTDTKGGLVFSNAGVIVDMGAHLAKAPSDITNVIDAGGRILAPGIVDLRVKTGEPGNENKETLATASNAAAAGGVTSFVVMPDTSPVIDTVALVDFINRRARDTAKASRVYAAGGLTVSLQGERMTEIGLMKEAGARLFTNGEQAVEDIGVLKRAMQYAAGFDALVMSRPDVHSLTRGSMINNSAFAARLGLKGAAPLAELMAVERDLILAEMTGASLLVDQISTARALEAIERARARGVDVKCTVSVNNLYFNEYDVGDYLTYCKVFPPFRSEDDRLAMIDGVARGVIDAVVSAHDPQPPENKRLPLPEATFGAAGLETLVSGMLSLVHDGKLVLLDAIRSLTMTPADIIKAPEGRLTPGAPADMVLIDFNAPWECAREDLRSRSQNSPFDGRRLQGRVARTFLGGETVFDRDTEFTTHQAT